MDKLSLYGWISIFCPYTNIYKATTRDFYRELWDGGEHVITSPTHDALESIIIKNDGDIIKVLEFIKNLKSTK